jgi:AsmA protein
MSRLIAILIGLVILVVAAILVLPMLISSDTYKGKLIEVVKVQTGRDLVIGGDVRLSIFPVLGVKAEDVRFSNAGWAKEPDMATMKTLRVSLKLIPLIRGELEIDSFVLVDPVIHIEVKADGTPNWRFESASPATETDAQAQADQTGQPEQTESTSANSRLKNLKLSNVAIENGSATYFSAQTGAKQSVEKINVELSMPALDDPFKADGSLVWNADQVSISLAAKRPRALTEGGDTPLTLSIKSPKLNASYDGTLRALEGMRFGGKVDLAVGSVRDLAAWLGSPMPAGNGFGKLTLSGNASGSADQYNFDDAKVGFDGMNASGNLALTTSGAKPFVKGKLTLDRIDANTYLTDPAGAAGTSPATAPVAGGAADDGWSNAPIDMSGLRAVNANFSLSADEILMRKIKIGASTLNLVLNNGVLTADLSRLALYQGSGAGKLTLNGTGATPQIAAQFSISGVAAEALLTDAADFKRLEGNTALSFSITTKGQSQRQMVGALNGSGEVKFTNGAIKGINLAQLMRNVFSAATTGWESGGSQDTDFSALGGSFTITNGLLTNKDLLMLSPLLRLSGAGTVDLPGRTLDYRVAPKLSATLEGQGGSTTAKGIEVPVIIEGPWASPRFRPDLKSMLENPDAIIDTVKELKKDGGKGLIDGLLGKKEAATPDGSDAGESNEETQTNKVDPAKALKNLFGN